MRLSNRTTLFAVLIALVFVTGGCASEGGGGGSATRATPANTAPPAGSPLSKVTVGMTDIDVRKVLGEPDRSNSYQTGKAWIPFYYGPDTARSDWMYDGQGRVVFSRNRYSGGLKVVNVIYNPSEGR